MSNDFYAEYLMTPGIFLQVKGKTDYDRRGDDYTESAAIVVKDAEGKEVSRTSVPVESVLATVKTLPDVELGYFVNAKGLTSWPLKLKTIQRGGVTRPDGIFYETLLEAQKAFTKLVLLELDKNTKDYEQRQKYRQRDLEQVVPNWAELAGPIMAEHAIEQQRWAEDHF